MLKLLYRIGTARPGRFLVGWMFAHMSFVIPLDRLRETGTLVAFRHPRPEYSFHIVLVPKKSIPSLNDLDPRVDAAFLGDLVATVQDLVKEFGLGEAGYRLIVNGGKFQEFPQLHYHLVSDTRTVHA